MMDYDGVPLLLCSFSASLVHWVLILNQFKAFTQTYPTERLFLWGIAVDFMMTAIITVGQIPHQLRGFTVCFNLQAT